MTGFNEFIKLFGNITILNVIEVIMAGIFLWLVYTKIRDYLIKKYEADKKKDDQIKEALESVRKYPEYRKQSLEIQESLKGEIQELRDGQQSIVDRLEKIEEQNQRRERNKLRDILLQSYRYYTNPEKNPTKTWTHMEAEAFWELFKDYEDAGGNGYMHTVVQPEMERLCVVDIDE